MGRRQRFDIRFNLLSDMSPELCCIPSGRLGGFSIIVERILARASRTNVPMTKVVEKIENLLELACSE